MREITITKKVYTFDELSQEAKDEAIFRYASCDCEDEDYKDFLDRFREYFWSDIDYSVGYGGTWGDITHPNELIETEMSPVRLSKWFINNLDEKILRCIENKEGCCLTGSYTDDDIDDVLTAVVSFKHNYTSIKEVYDSILYRTMHTWERNRDYRWSEECFSEESTELGYEYYEDGTRV